MKRFAAIFGVAFIGLASLLQPVAAATAPQPGASQPAIIHRSLQLAQVAFAGIYQGDVQRHRINGGAEETRMYRIALNPDMQNGIVWIYSGGKLLYILLFSGTLDGNTFTGKTRPVQAGAGYTPDNIRLDFTPDGKSVRWQHNDGKILGSGILNRI